MNRRDIQYISNKKVEMNKVESLDTYKVNVVKLSNIWYQRSANISFIDNIDLYKLLGNMIENSIKSKVIIIIPQNILYYYYNNSYSIELKYIIPNLKLQLKTMFGINQIIYDDICYENTETKIKDKNIKASFYFKAETPEKVLKSIGSEKITAISKKNLIYTTLDINEENFLDFIDEFLPELTQENDNKPEWFSETEYFDDKENKLQIEEEKRKILESERIIEEKQVKLTKNDYYKSILYSTGDDLVTKVFSILEEILGYNLSNFIDTKKEDFLIKLEDLTLIGEIKGVSKSVKSANIAQTEKHLRIYLDDYAEENENGKGILIINPQRMINPKMREKVHENEKKLAIKYEILVILAEDLLKLYEMFVNKKINSEEIIRIFKEETGLFSLDLIEE